MGRVQAAIVIGAGAFLALVVLAYMSGGGDREAAAVRPAPAFRLEGAGGEPVTLESLRGRTVLLNFWATWCPPCVEETPSLEALHRRLAPAGLVVVGVSVDQEWPEVRRFIERFGVTYRVLLDPTGATPRRYGTFKYPETYLIDPAGTILHRYVGAVDWTRPDVRADIERVLGAAPPPPR